MKYFYDTEFYESGPSGPVSWISIGIVNEKGDELYLENREFDWSPVPHDHFIMENVAPHLQGGDCQVTRLEAADLIRGFITQGGTEFNNELWAYYAAYDHVVLAQIFGRMVDMPDGVPWFTQDIRQEQERLTKLYFKHGLMLPKQKTTEHHALADAKWTKEAYYFLQGTADAYYGQEIVDGWE